MRCKKTDHLHVETNSIGNDVSLPWKYRKTFGYVINIEIQISLPMIDNRREKHRGELEWKETKLYQ